MHSLVESLMKPSPKALEQSTSIAASTVFHVVLLAALALAVFPNRDEREINTIISDFSNFETTVQPIELEAASLADDSSESMGASAPQDHAFLSEIKNSEVDATPKAEQAVTLTMSPVGIATGNLAERVSPLVLNSSSGDGASGDGTSGDGNGDGVFFGLNLKGASVVFVVDASSSMNHPHPGPAKTRFGRVKIELFQAINKMTDVEKFFMIFFNDFSIPMPASRLVSATPENRQMFLKWMAPGQAIGNTEPEVALMTAIRLRPEVIYFLTDGQFKYSVVQNVSAANKAKVVINTICFGDDTGEKFLKQLAQRNGGIYKFVSDEQEIIPSDQDAKTKLPAPPGITRLPNLN